MAGPRWDDYSGVQGRQECLNHLETTYIKTFAYVNKYLSNYTSIALPLISSGIFGVPKNYCFEKLFSSILNYCLTNPKASNYLKRIRLPHIDPQLNIEMINYFRDQIQKLPKRPKLEILEPISKITTITANSDSLSVERKMQNCVICGDMTLIIKQLPCNCKYCKDCVQNYEQTNKCKCL